MRRSTTRGCCLSNDNNNNNIRTSVTYTVRAQITCSAHTARTIECVQRALSRGRSPPPPPPPVQQETGIYGEIIDAAAAAAYLHRPWLEHRPSTVVFFERSVFDQGAPCRQFLLNAIGPIETLNIFYNHYS